MSLPLREDQHGFVTLLRSIEQELKTHAFSHKLASALSGAVGEMIDNVWQHSAWDGTPLLGYELRRGKFAFSVADLGQGILASLRTNPKYSEVSTSLSAVKAALKPGVSRFDSGGYGYATLLRSVASLSGMTRLRSGAAAVQIDNRLANRTVVSRHLPSLSGVQVSAYCSLSQK